eukprot:4710354-Prorocentrum_lima.AAC.1
MEVLPSKPFRRRATTKSCRVLRSCQWSRDLRGRRRGRCAAVQRAPHSAGSTCVPPRAPGGSCRTATGPF